MFWAWEIFCHTHERRELKRTVRQLQRQYKPIIRSFAAKRARNKRCRGMARNLLKAWPALWTFAAHRGVEPTNNHAERERALRGAVIYRKLSLGSQSEQGERRIERLLSAHTTRRLQHRCSSTRPSYPPLTPAATQFRCSPERGPNAYKKASD